MRAAAIAAGLGALMRADKILCRLIDASRRADGFIESVGLAWDLAEAAYRHERAWMECERAGMKHTDLISECERCKITNPLEDAEREARGRLIVHLGRLRGAR